MTPEQLSQVCRCGHARRFHRQGTLMEGYSTACHHMHTSKPEYGIGCFYFEREGELVVLRRDSRGRFLSVKPV